LGRKDALWQSTDKIQLPENKVQGENTMAQKEQKPQKNNKKAPAKSLKEKRQDKQAKAEGKKRSQ
jgi:hypothetical protein